MSSPSTATARRNLGADADYAELKRIVKERGLLNKQPRYYTFRFIVTLAMFALSWVILFAVDNPWVQVLNAVYMGFMMTQVGFLGHDLGHGQVFHDRRRSDTVGLLLGNGLMGMSRSWWVNKHNAHHANPNVDDMDPDIDIPILAFSEQDALSKQGFLRHLVRYQAYYFIPITFFQAWGMHKISVETLIKDKPAGWRSELTVLIIHFIVYAMLVFLALGVPMGLLFIFIQKSVTGLYNASVFAPNHKGMPVLDKDNHLDFLRKQVLTSRNIQAHPITDFWYGGLNYQIEHHLFPTMPRNQLRESQAIVVDFCRQKGIPYHETSILGSYREIISYLHEVSEPLRAEARASAAA